MDPKYHEEMYKKVTLIVLTTGILFAFVSCGGKKSKTPEEKIKVDSTKVISGYGKVEPLANIIHLTSERSGVVNLVKVQEGDTLTRGDTILVLDHREEKANLEKLEAQADAARVGIKTADAGIEIAREELENKKQYYERLKDAWENHSESRQNLDNAKFQYQQAANKLKQADLNKENRITDLRVLEKEYARAKIKYNKLFIRAPSDGTLLDFSITTGDPVQAFTKLGDFAPAGPLSVKAEIDELFAEEVTRGMKADIVPFGRQDTIATGTVVYAAPSLREKSIFSDSPSDFNDRRIREIRIRIDRMKENALIGQRVNAYIELNP